jgi:hypothetical protein
MKAIENDEIQELSGEEYDVEWEYEKVPEPTDEQIKSKERDFTFGTKEETFLWAYETIFNWLGINFDYHHKEQFWKAIQYDVANDQEQLYEIRLRQIMEYEICGERFKWWNEASRRARIKRTKNFQSDLFRCRSDKLICSNTSFIKTCKIRLKEILQGSYFN